MVPSTRNRNSKTRSASGHSAKKKSSEEACNVGAAESNMAKARGSNTCNRILPSDSLVDEANSTAPILKRRGKNGRPPLLPKRKATGKTTQKKEASDLDDDLSPLKKKNLLGKASNAIAIMTSTSGRPLRRAAAAKKKQYTDADSETDGETSSSDESEYDTKNNVARRAPILRKTNKRKKGTPSSSKISSKSKRARNKTPSPQTKLRTHASPATKKIKGSPYILSTPQGASIGLTPIKDSISKVWKNDGGDWRVSGAIDYGFD